MAVPPRAPGPEELTTARLRLRPYRRDDECDFVAVFTDAATMTHVGGALARREAERVFSEILHGTHPRARAAWTVEDGHTGAHVGHAALLAAGAEVELGFVLRPEAWGRGLATELARALAGQARRRFAGARIVATVDIDHGACQRVLEKAGMTLAGERSDDDGVCLVYELCGRGSGPGAVTSRPARR